ncbi:MAG: hypothetical protein KDA61_22500, partial [Planctomycetales bacterium]|nr:hypothetical protein [Planctomycetales bacterium]
EPAQSKVHADAQRQKMAKLLIASLTPRMCVGRRELCDLGRSGQQRYFILAAQPSAAPTFAGQEEQGDRRQPILSRRNAQRQHVEHALL